MKKYILFGALAAILALGSFDVAWASHTIASISPSTGAPGSTISATITGTGFCVAPAAPPCNVGPGFIPPANITISTAVASTANSISITFTIGSNAATGSRTLQITNTDGHTTGIGFTVAVGGPGGPGGPGGGGGFVEPVPTRFGPIPEGPQTGNEFISVVEGITNWIFVILLVFAVIFILLAAFQFIAGGGEPQAVAQARQKLIWAAVGIAVAVLARGIPAAIANLFL